jgi:hypothetical protein
MTVEKKIVDLNVEPMPQIIREVEEAVEEVAPQSEPIVDSPVEPEPSVQAPPVAQPDVDEFGVPWKNRAMEYRRKNEEFAERLPQLIDEKLSKLNQPQTPAYTYEQLEAYKLQNSTDANVVAWATGEQRKLQRAEDDKRLQDLLGSRDRQRELETGRQRAFEAVKQKYPDALNQNSPMFNLVREYMQIPEFANRPDGLFFAAKMAKADMLESQTPILQQKVQAQKAEIKQAQKASFTEGAGRRVTNSVSPVNSAVDSLRKSGSMKDAESAIGAILRQRGIITE